MWIIYLDWSAFHSVPLWHLSLISIAICLKYLLLPNIQQGPHLTYNASLSQTAYLGFLNDNHFLLIKSHLADILWLHLFGLRLGF